MFSKPKNSRHRRLFNAAGGRYHPRYRSRPHYFRSGTDVSLTAACPDQPNLVGNSDLQEHPGSSVTVHAVTNQHIDTDNVHGPSVSLHVDHVYSVDDSIGTHSTAMDHAYVTNASSMSSNSMNSNPPNQSAQSKHAKPYNLEGYRIMHLPSFSDYISKLTLHASQCPHAAQFAARNEPLVQFLGERFNHGLASFLEAKCLGCGVIFPLTSSPKVQCKESERFEVNVRAVWGQMSTGGGGAHLARASRNL